MCGEEGICSFAEVMEMGCCGCFGFLRKHNQAHPGSQFSQKCLLQADRMDDVDGWSEGPNLVNSRSSSSNRCVRSSEEILLARVRDGLVCRETPVKETRRVTHSKDENGNKILNEFVREGKLGSGSYGKVALYRNNNDGVKYAIKVFNKPHLQKLHVGPSETAMSDVMREVAIMKMLNHPNIVNLIEVIDDPNTDDFYMVLEYVQGKWVFEGSGPLSSLDERTCKRYLRDIVAGLMYLHDHKIVHGDIKPDNLLVTSNGNVKIGDFSVSQVYENDNDELRRSPGTPVFTAPECCLCLTYHGRASDIWAVGVTLYCMTFGQYPFLADTLQDTYDKIVHNPVRFPKDINPSLKNLLEALLCKDPKSRITLRGIAEHPWVIGADGPIPEYICMCQRKIIERRASSEQAKGR